MTACMILIGIVFIGGMLTLCKCGEKDGICDYGQVIDDDHQNR